MNKVSAFVMGASIGCALGALAALALTPQSGEQTREIVMEKAEEAMSDVQDFNTGLAYYATGVAQDARKRGEETLKGIRGKNDDSTNDDLQAKIDSVRERIAEQAVG